jgi:hypothetical protein
MMSDTEDKINCDYCGALIECSEVDNFNICLRCYTLNAVSALEAYAAGQVEAERKRCAEICDEFKKSKSKLSEHRDISWIKKQILNPVKDYDPK